MALLAHPRHFFAVQHPHHRLNIGPHLLLLRAQSRGILLADTKFEFGEEQGELVLIDELLSPDSSRFWPAAELEIGKSLPSYDKQIVRDHLEQTGWDKSPPPPELPDSVVERTSRKYREIYERLTGERFETGD